MQVLLILLLSVISILAVSSSKMNNDGCSVVDRHVDRGKSFEIELEGNPTTGYTWNLAETNQPNDPYIKFIGEEYQQQHQLGGPIILGSGGIFKFQFDVEPSCPAGYQMQLVFLYKRSWEPDPIETRTYCITCDDQ